MPSEGVDVLESLKVLKPACIAALKRIFKLCDVNKDGILDGSELNEFQVMSSAHPDGLTPLSLFHRESVLIRLCSSKSWKESKRWCKTMLKVEFAMAD